MTAACASFEPLLFDFGVDLYLAGHLHFYQRFDGAMRRGRVISNGSESGYTNPAGPIHITTGSGGPPKGSSCQDFGQQGHPPAGVYAKCVGSLQFSYSQLTATNASHLSWKQLRNNDSAVVDRWTLRQDRHGPFAWVDPPFTKNVAKTDDGTAAARRYIFHVRHPTFSTNASTCGGACFTDLVRAQCAARQQLGQLRSVRSAAKATVEVVIYGDSSTPHVLTSPLLFGPEDSGDARIEVLYRAAPGSKPVISAGVPVTNWVRQQAPGRWRAPLPDASGLERSNSMWGDDERFVQARIPNSAPGEFASLQWIRPLEPGLATADINRWGLVARAEDVPADLNTSGTSAVMFHSYDTSFCQVLNVTVNPVNRSEAFVYFANPMAEPLQLSSWYLEVSGRRWFISNSEHGLDAAGEFWIDRERREVTLILPVGKSPARVVLGAQLSVLRLE
jgi:hypothetical protein